VNFAD